MEQRQRSRRRRTSDASQCQGIACRYTCVQKTGCRRMLSLTRLPPVSPACAAAWPRRRDRTVRSPRSRPHLRQRALCPSPTRSLPSHRIGHHQDRNIGEAAHDRTFCGGRPFTDRFQEDSAEGRIHKAVDQRVEQREEDEHCRRARRRRHDDRAERHHGCADDVTHLAVGAIAEMSRDHTAHRRHKPPTTPATIATMLAPACQSSPRPPTNSMRRPWRTAPRAGPSPEGRPRARHGPDVQRNIRRVCMRRGARCACSGSRRTEARADRRRHEEARWRRQRRSMCRKPKTETAAQALCRRYCQPATIPPRGLCDRAERNAR